MDIKSPSSPELEPMTNENAMPTMIPVAEGPIVPVETPETKKNRGLLVFLIVLGVAILAVILFWLFNQPANTSTTGSVTNPSTQASAATSSSSSAALISPTPIPATTSSSQTPGVLSLGGASGGAGSTSGGGSSTSSTSLTTDNKYSYYTTANGEVVMTTPSPTPTPTPTPNPTPNPTPTANPTPTPSNPTPTPTASPTPTPTNNPTPTPSPGSPAVLGAYAGSTISSIGTGNGFNASTVGADGFARIIYHDAAAGVMKFVQCTNADCSQKNITTITAELDGSPSIAMAPDGYARISYNIFTTNKLQYIQCTNPSCSSRTTTALDASITVSWTSIAVASDGFARIAYTNNTSDDVKFIQCLNLSCSSINSNNVDTAGDVGRGMSMTLGSNDFARIAYYDWNNQALKFAQCTNASCSTKNITTVVSYSVSNANGDWMKVNMTPDGFARIAYYDMGNGDLGYVQCTNADCTTKNLTTVDSTGDVGNYVSMGTGNDGFSRISYVDTTNDDLKYAQCTNAACTTKVVTALATSGSYAFTSLSVGLDGYSRISYYDFGTIKLWVESTYTGMTSNTVESTNNVGQYASTAIGSDGYNRISFYDTTNGDLRFVRCTNGPCTSKVSTLVDSAGNVGQFTSMAMGTDGFARIAYYDVTHNNIKYVRCTNADCSTSNLRTIEAMSGSDNHLALAMASDGFARLVYYNGSGQLRFAKCSDDDCSSPSFTTVVGSNAGRGISLAMASDGFARIGYYVTSTGDLNFIQCSDATCATRSDNAVDTTNDVGYSHGMVLGSDGLARFDYIDLNTNHAKYAKCDNASCNSVSTFTDLGLAGAGSYESFSIAMGTDGFARLSYFDSVNSWLRYTKCTNTACSTRNVITADSGPGSYFVGQYSSIVVSQTDGWARIAYPDGINGDLKLWLEDTAAGAPSVSSFYYSVAPGSGIAGSASTVFTVGVKDVGGNIINAPSNTPVYLYSSGSGGTFSTTSGGSYTSALTITIPSGNPSADYYYMNNSTAGSPYTLTASDNSSAPDGGTGIVDATTLYAVNAGTASSAVLTPSTQSVAAGVASSVVTLTTKDSLGNVSNVASNTSFALSSTGVGGQFSVLSTPFTPVSTVTVSSGSSSTTFFYRNNTAGSYTITAHAASGFSDGTSTITVNPAAIASYYYATAPASGAAGASSTVFTVGAHDAFGNVVTVGSNQVVYLYSSAPAGTFSNTTSAGPFTATTTTILSGNTTAGFYYKNNSTSGDPYTITASDNSSAPDGATGIVDATTSYTVNAGGATTSSLTPSSQSTTAGATTSVITLTTKDSLGNPTPVASNTTFTLSDADGGQFSVLASPFTPVSTVTVNSGNSTATFFYRNNTAGSYTITAHNAGFSPDSTTSVTVTAAAISSYYFVTAPGSANISVASSAFVVGAHDVFGNVVTVASNTTVYLYSTSGTGTFSNSGSGGPFTATTVTVLAGNATATFYYKDSIAGAYTLTASDQTPTPTPDTGITNATTAFTVFNPDVVVGPNMPLPVRSATLNDSRPGDPNVHFSWNSSSVNTIKGIRIQVCTDGLKNTACTTPTGANLSTSTLSATGGQLGVTGWAITTVVSAHEILITNYTGAATTIGGTSTLDLAGFTNPTSIGTFFFRISTYTTTVAAPGDSVGYGAIADSTARSLTVTGDVAESLVFRVANSVASDCSSQTDIADPNDAASDLVTLSPNPMTMTTTSIGTAQMCATSNAQHGYTITYFDAALGGATKGFYNGAHEFPSVNQFTSTQGSEQFGFNLRANTTPAVGFDPDGNGLVADLTNADYGTTDRFSYNDTGTPTILAQKSVPNAATARYTMSYIANISSTTQGGTYKAHQVFVITATF